MTKKMTTAIVLGWGLLAAGCAPRETAFKAAGVVDGQVVTVRTLAAGRLKDWSVKPGKEVRKGDVLGRIDDGRIGNGLEELAIDEREIALAEDRGRSQMPALQAKVDFIKKMVERLERLKKDQAVSGGELEKAQLELLAAETALADLKKSLDAVPIQKAKVANKRRSIDLAVEDLTLRSPVDGVILEAHVTDGETLLTGGAVADILDMSSLRIDVYVEERELSRLRLNDRVAILVDGQAGKERPGTIVQFGSTAEFSPRFTLSEKERSALLYKVRIAIDADPQTFKIGMPVTVVFGRSAAKG